MEKDQKPIQFQAITTGLGFHPFSDGLPYAPVSKAPTKPQAAPLDPTGLSGPTIRPRDLSGGAGAVAAGPATFVNPMTARAPQPSPAPRVSVPVATPTRAKARVPQPQVQRQKQKQTPVTAPAAQLITEAKYGFLYLIKRMLAYGIDTVLNVTLLATGLSFALLNQDVNPDLLMTPGILLISVLFFTLFNWALVTAQEIAFGTTVGKRIFGLALQGSTSALFLRAFFFLPSIGFCGVGLLWGVIDSKKRCWHDLVVNVQPSEIARL